MWYCRARGILITPSSSEFKLKGSPWDLRRGSGSVSTRVLVLKFMAVLAERGFTLYATVVPESWVSLLATLNIGIEQL